MKPASIGTDSTINIHDSIAVVKVEVKEEIENKDINFTQCFIKTENEPEDYLPYEDLKIKKEELDLKTEYGNIMKRYYSENGSNEILNGDSKMCSSVKEEDEIVLEQEQSMEIKENFKCSLCSFQCPFKRTLNSHLLKIHKCKDLINKKFSSGKTGKNLKYKCEQCTYKTNFKGHLTRHVKTHENIKDLKCSYCSKIFSRKFALNDHLINIHECKDVTGKIHECDKCSYITTMKSQILRHQLKHDMKIESDKKFKCQQCSFESYSKNSLNAHMNRHKTRDFKCTYTMCSKKFVTKCSLDNHLLKSHKCSDNIVSEILKCNDCNYETIKKSDMLQHNLHDTKLKIHKCQQCTYETNLKCNLYQHMKVHNNRDFKCMYCSKEFTYKNGLDYHLISTHKRRDNITCPVYECDDEKCNYMSINKNHFFKHKLKHGIKQGLEKVMCDQCPYETYRKGDLSVHMKKQHGKE